MIFLRSHGRFSQAQSHMIAVIVATPRHLHYNYEIHSVHIEIILKNYLYTGNL